ncbi:MAG TPA: N-acetyltransferase [Actinomycetota bacterium]
MNEITIRVEEPDDRAASFEVEREAFGSDEEAAIVVAVRDLDGSFALVAVDGDAVVGHVQMSRAWIGETTVLSLGPIGVLPSRQGEGIGSALVRAALDAAAERGESIVMLLGSPAYYGRFGFRPGSEWGLSNPYAGIDEGSFVIQEGDFQIAVAGGRAVELSGVVRWHPSFGDVG